MRLPCPLQSLQISEDQFGQIIAVTAFKNAEIWDVQTAELASKPVKILRFHGFIGKGITRVGVETGGNRNQIGFPALEVFESFCQMIAVNFARCSRRNRIIVTVPN